ncbi:histone PARylation factor 1 [Galendromus occidentalis]|uniref:Histone PARylation factor 1 n=1 Tax=Galendromus occidentalis TaxID=34638 RepID=A0AAJ7SEV1_9ACAR|nr:histone PARylation factor 1 [Galendromus occidentalis]
MTTEASSSKRTSDEIKEESDKPLCKFGPLCYRKNPAHLREFAHPNRKAEATRSSPKASPVSNPAKKLKISPPLVPEPQHADAAFLQECYETPFPEDFFDLWNFCKALNPGNPREALVPLVNYRLIGPFDALALKDCVDKTDKKSFNLHCRYYYDPPEFQTLMVEVGTDNHYGYFRDDPNDFPVFVANSQLSRKDIHPWKLVIVGANLMQTVNILLKDRIKECAADSEQKTILTEQLAKVTALSQNKHFVSYKSKRKTRALGSCLHHVGMVVPYEDKTQVGYRPLPVSNVELRKMMQCVDNASEASLVEALTPIQNIVTLVNFANDECDYGMGLELGLDLFLFGSPHLHKTALFLLGNAYMLLERPKFLEILKDHIENRRKDGLEYLKLIPNCELKNSGESSDSPAESSSVPLQEPFP